MFNGWCLSGAYQLNLSSMCGKISRNSAFPLWCTRNMPVTLAEKKRAYCYGIEKSGDHVKIRKNRRFT